MRDFRDAKAMARSPRDALNARAVETTHSESLELISKAFGYENWNVLAAQIEAANAPSTDRRSPPPSRNSVILHHRRSSTARSAARASTRCGN